MDVASFNRSPTLWATFLASAAITLAIAPGCAHAAPPSKVEHGAYLVLVGGCNDCHTPLKMGAGGPEPDLARMLSGHPEALVMPPPPPAVGPWIWSGAATNTAFAGPWGVSYSVNLTPDPTTGLGRWTEAQFVAALTSGKHLGVGRPILPPMPWSSTARMHEADLRAMFAYLRTVPAVKNRVPEATPPPAAAAAHAAR